MRDNDENAVKDRPMTTKELWEARCKKNNIHANKKVDGLKPLKSTKDNAAKKEKRKSISLNDFKSLIENKS